jgi:hypothetical protein
VNDPVERVVDRTEVVWISGQMNLPISQFDEIHAADGIGAWLPIREKGGV